MRLDLSRRPVTLRFDPPPNVVDLDDDGDDFDVVASTEDDGATRPLPSVPIDLASEIGATIATTGTDGSGRAHFVVPRTREGPGIGEPGRGELRATFEGNAEFGPGSCTASIERVTRVDLVAQGFDGSTEDEIVIPVKAQARRPSSFGAGGAPSGTVEAYVGDSLVGASQLVQGAARVLLNRGGQDGDSAVRLHFSPDSPWFRPGDDVIVTPSQQGPSFWRHWPPFACGDRRCPPGSSSLGGRAGAPCPSAAPRCAPPNASRPKSSFSTATRAPEVGVDTSWTPTTQRTPIAAGICIERPGFEHVEVLLQTTSDASGAFSLPRMDALKGDELALYAPIHAPLRSPLPAPGDLRISLVLRRRALLDRLVSWARRRLDVRSMRARRSLPHRSRPRRRCRQGRCPLGDRRRARRLRRRSGRRASASGGRRPRSPRLGRIARRAHAAAKTSLTRLVPSPYSPGPPRETVEPP